MKITPESEFLSKEELKQLCGKAHRSVQLKVLAELGFPHRDMPHALLVSRHHVRLWLEGKPLPRPSRGLNLDAVR